MAEQGEFEKLKEEKIDWKQKRRKELLIKTMISKSNPTAKVNEQKKIKDFISQEKFK